MEGIVLPYLRSQGLLGYVDGSKPSPAKFATHTSNDGATQVLNPDYITWYQQDQFVFSALLSYISEETLSHVIILSTSQEVWSFLENMFSSTSRARIM